jgi:hypothetical protein
MRQAAEEAVEEITRALQRGARQVRRTVAAATVWREREGGDPFAAGWPPSAHLDTEEYPTLVIEVPEEHEPEVVVPVAEPGGPIFNRRDEERLVLWVSVGILWLVVGTIIGLRGSDLYVGILAVLIFYCRDWIRSHRV